MLHSALASRERVAHARIVAAARLLAEQHHLTDQVAALSSAQKIRDFQAVMVREREIAAEIFEMALVLPVAKVPAKRKRSS